MTPVKVKLARKILESNDKVAAEVRRLLSRRGLCMLNIMGSPGSGKTELIRALADTDPEFASTTAVIEGDVASSIDGERIAQKGLEVVQINTGGACHLSAGMVRDALEDLDLDRFRLLIVENVGNLVCPAAFDLGEDARLVTTAVTEGSEKPTKYPGMYAKAQALAVTKCDLAEAAGVDPADISRRALEVNPSLRVFLTSARSGRGLAEVARWLAEHVRRKREGD